MSKTIDQAVIKRLEDVITTAFPSKTILLGSVASDIAHAIYQAGFTDIAPIIEHAQPVPVATLKGNDILNALAYRQDLLIKDIGDCSRSLSRVGMLPSLVEEMQQLAAAHKAIRGSGIYTVY